MRTADTATTSVTTNDELNVDAGRRLSTTATRSDKLDVQVSSSGDARSNDFLRQLTGEDWHESPDDDGGCRLTDHGDRPPWSFVHDASSAATCRTQFDFQDDAAAPNRVAQEVLRDVSGGTVAETDAETEAGQNSSAHAHCTAVARLTSGDHDDARRSSSPPDVAADADVLATAAADAVAAGGSRSPYTAMARAASRAASAAVGHAIWQVRDVGGGTERYSDAELELSARCLVRCHSSTPPHRSATLSCNYFRRRGYAFNSVCLFVCVRICVRRITECCDGAFNEENNG